MDQGNIKVSEFGSTTAEGWRDAFGMAWSREHCYSPFFDSIAQSDDCFEGPDYGVAIILLLGFRQLRIRDETRMFLSLVLPPRAVSPTIGQALLGPEVVGVLGQAL